MSAAVAYLAAALLAASVLLAAIGYALLRTRSASADEADPGLSGRSEATRGGPVQRLIDTLGAPLAPLAGRSMSVAARTRVRDRIDAAGRPGGMTFETYLRRRTGTSALATLLAVFALLTGHPVIALLVFVAGLILTDFILWQNARERQEQITRDFPDFLDVLAVTVSAGLGFRQALERVAENTGGPVAEEIQITLRQMELGSPRRQAFSELRRRNASRALASFVGAVLQAEELGAPLSRALMEISTDMRREAAQAARRRAQRTEPRVSLVTTFVLLPGILVLVGGMLFFTGNGGLGGILG